MSIAPSARAAYRRWHAAAGPWAGFVRVVPLVALAQGMVPRPTAAPEPPEEVVAGLAQAGTQEGWLGRADVLLVLDLPSAVGLGVAAGLARWGVRPVPLIFLWPEPGALLAAEPVLAALLRYAPPVAAGGAPAQFALVLDRERSRPASAADLAVRFDNRYELGGLDLPSAARLRAGGIGALVACCQAAAPPTADLAGYLDGLEAGGLPIRRLALD